MNNDEIEGLHADFKVMSSFKNCAEDRIWGLSPEGHDRIEAEAQAREGPDSCV
jgi:hypothetical protein